MFRTALISEAAQREPRPRRGIAMFGMVDKAHDSRKMLVLVWKRLKQNSKPEYLPTLCFKGLIPGLLRLIAGLHHDCSDCPGGS